MSRKSPDALALVPDPDFDRPVDRVDAKQQELVAAEKDVEALERSEAEAQERLSKIRARKTQAATDRREAVRVGDGQARARHSLEEFSAIQEEADEQQSCEEAGRAVKEAWPRINVLREELRELLKQRAAGVKVAEGVEIISRGFEHLSGVDVAGGRLEKILNELTAQGATGEVSALMRVLDDARGDFHRGLKGEFLGGRFIQ